MNLVRYPVRKNETLLAWDSADELMLAHMKTLPLEGKRLLILNDHFGALSLGLEGFDCTVYTDSFVSAMGLRMNSSERLSAVNNLKALSGIYDYVLVQIPKNMSFFEDQLSHLTHHLGAHSILICGTMIKHLSPTSFELINKYIGATTTSLAQKKARLIFATFEKTPVNSTYPKSVTLESFDKPFLHHSNLFSREKLDIGTRFFLEHLPRGSLKDILDLGCANGIIGIRAKELNPQAQIYFSDDSAMAIESARVNYSNYFSDSAQYFWTNCFENQPSDMLDHVLCNPPFHQGTTVGDFIAWQMFQDAHRSLKAGGVLRVIGNSHLGYQMKLKKIFGNSKIVATNAKFIICDAVK